MGAQHLWWFLVTPCLPAAHLLPASPQTCCLLQTTQIPFSHLLSSETQGSVEQLGGMGLDWVIHTFDVKPW